MLRFVGDCCFADIHFDIGYGVGSYISNGGNPFRYLKKNPNDIWIGNFECVCSNISTHNDYHKDSMRIAPEKLKNCQFIDYFCIANNHVMEHGDEAYRQMQHNLKSFCNGTFGSLENKSISFQHQGKSVSVTGFCLRREENPFTPLYWSQPELSEIKSELSNLNSDFKVAYIHWGVEFINHPSTEQIKFAHWLIDIGYDLIIGMHPHILQGYEIYNGKHIFYSIGNFVFNMVWEETKYSTIVNVDLKTNKVSFDYVKIEDNYSPKLINETDTPTKIRFETINKNIKSSLNPEEYIIKAQNGLKQYRKYNYLAFFRNLHKYNILIFKGIISDFIKRRFFQ